MRAALQNGSKSGNGGFTLVETMVSLVIGSLLITALFQVWNNNRQQTDRIQNKSDFRDRATLATTALNRSITMAGFGLTKIDVLARGAGSLNDTLKIFSNPDELRTTLRDTARVGAHQILVFKDTGLVIGNLIGITDSIRQEYVRIDGITGDTASGFLLTISPALSNGYLPGVPDIFPVQKETYFIDNEAHALVRLVDDRRIVLASGMTEFKIDLRDGAGNPATINRKIRVVTFSLTGAYKAPTGVPNQMRFSSTVIPRNIL
ncbi:MAG: hypothetical protein JWP91_49 [Fibrobacteres bacterium]|nr:hypothetical protein [Fibrobacterota bacterium]